MSKYTVDYTRMALRQLDSMPANEKQKVLGKIYQYAEFPGSLKNQACKLQGREGFRLRVGKWRVMFDINGKVMYVQQVGPCGKIYKGV